MNSIFAIDRAPAPESGTKGLEVPAEVQMDFGQLFDWYTPTVFVSWTILAINVLVFLAMLASGFDPDKATPQILLRWGADYGPVTIAGGEWWRTLTCVFVHLGFLHIFFNMSVLAQIGPFMERLFGNIGFLIVYLICGLAGSLCSLAWNPYLFSAGASGAIFGLYGALIGFLTLRRGSIPGAALAKLMKSALLFIGYNAVFGFLHSGTDMAAHAGGLLGGFLCGLVISSPVDSGFSRRRTIRAAGVGIASAAVLLGVGAALPRPLDFQKEARNLVAVEKKVLATYRAIMQSARDGRAGDAQTADRIQSDVIGPWQQERNSLATFTGLPRQQQRFAGNLLG